MVRNEEESAFRRQKKIVSTESRLLSDDDVSGNLKPPKTGLPISIDRRIANCQASLITLNAQYG